MIKILMSTYKLLVNVIVVLLKASRAYEKSLLGVRLGENAALLPILKSEFKLTLSSSVDLKSTNL